MITLRVCLFVALTTFAVSQHVAHGQTNAELVAKEGKLKFDKFVFDPPLGSRVPVSELVTVEFEYHNETGHDLSVCIGPVYDNSKESSGCSPLNLQQGKGVGKASFDFGWALLDPSGKRVLMLEYNEETRKSTPLPRPQGTKVTSLLSNITGVGFQIYGGPDKTTENHVVAANFLPFSDTVFQPGAIPSVDVRHTVALAKANIEGKAIALIEPKIGQISFEVLVDIKRIKKDGTTDVIPGVETFAREVVLEQVKSEVPADQLSAWSIDGTPITPSELLVILSKPTHVIVAPAHADGKTMLSPYYRAIFRSDLIIIQKTQSETPASKP